MKILLRILKWTLSLCMVLFFFAPSTARVFSASSTIRDLVLHAKSIRLEHFHKSFDGPGEVLINSTDLVPGDFYHVSDAFPLCLDAGIPGLQLGCIFDPHHRIIITDATGHTTVINVCFECDHVEIKHAGDSDGDLFSTPLIWCSILRHFFSDMGMPNSPDLYRFQATDEPATNSSSATGK